MSVKKKVARGALWLDHQNPGWYRKIDLNRLDMGSNYDCIIGQLFATLYEDAYDWHVRNGQSIWWARHHGFSLMRSPYSYPKQWAVLREAWKVEIYNRLLDENILRFKRNRHNAGILELIEEEKTLTSA